MPGNNATLYQERDIQADIDCEPSDLNESAICHPHGRYVAMRRFRRATLAGLVILAGAYIFSDWLGDWAFWLDVVGELCIVSAIASALKN